MKQGSLALLIGRLLIAIFHCIAPAVIALAVWEQLEIFSQSYGIRFDLGWARLWAVLLLALGAAIVIGLWVRLFSLIAALLAFIALFTQLAYWNLASYQEFIVRLLFMHSSVVVGGLLLFAAAGGGKYSLVSREIAPLARRGYYNWTTLVARIFLGGGFIWMAICGVAYWDLHVLFLEGSNIPFPYLIHTLGLMMEFLGGLLLLVGFQQRFASALLMVYVVLVTLFVHQPWDLSLFDAIAIEKGLDMETFIRQIYPSDRLLRTQFLFDHLAILGALFAAYVTPLGRFSLEGSAPRRR